jgi:hypothetical protein
MSWIIQVKRYSLYHGFPTECFPLPTLTACPSAYAASYNLQPLLAAFDRFGSSTNHLAQGVLPAILLVAEIPPADLSISWQAPQWRKPIDITLSPDRIVRERLFEMVRDEAER